MHCSLFNNTGKFWGKLMETCKINFSKFKIFKHSTSVKIERKNIQVIPGDFTAKGQYISGKNQKGDYKLADEEQFSTLILK